MPTFQRKALRQSLGTSYLHDTLVGNTTGSCGSDVYAYALDSRQADLSLSNGDAGSYERAHLRVQGSDLRVASFNCGSGAFVTMQLLGTIVPSGAEYEVHEMVSAADKDRVLTQVVGRLTRRAEYPIAAVDGDKSYAVPADVLRILDAYYFADPTSLVDRRKGHFAHVAIVTTGSGRELRIEPAIPSGYQIALDAVTSLTLGPADTDAVELPSDEWLLYGAEAACWNLLTKKGPGQETSRYERNARLAAASFSRRSSLYAPQIDSSIKLDDAL
jgi:hypothetical protein